MVADGPCLSSTRRGAQVLTAATPIKFCLQSLWPPNQFLTLQRRAWSLESKCLVGFLPVDIRWRRRVRSNHGPSSTTELYFLHCRHPGEGVGRLCVAGVEPHHLLGR